MHTGVGVVAVLCTQTSANMTPKHASTKKCESICATAKHRAKLAHRAAHQSTSSTCYHYQNHLFGTRQHSFCAGMLIDIRDILTQNLGAEVLMLGLSLLKVVPVACR